MYESADPSWPVGVSESSSLPGIFWKIPLVGENLR